MDLVKLLIVGGGGLMGSVARYVTTKFVDSRLSGFPYGTLTVNLIGSFVLGLVFALTLKGTSASANWRLFLGTGFCGGFTTFSAFALENYMLLNNKLIGMSIVYMVLSLAAGVIALALGIWCTRFL